MRPYLALNTNSYRILRDTLDVVIRGRESCILAIVVRDSFDPFLISLDCLYHKLLAPLELTANQLAGWYC